MLLKQKQILEIFWWKFLQILNWLLSEQRNVVLCSQCCTYTDNLLVFYWQLVPHISLYRILISQSHNASDIYIPQPFLSLQLDLFLVEIQDRPDQWLIDQYFNVCTLWNFPSSTRRLGSQYFCQINPLSILSQSSLSARALKLRKHFFWQSLTQSQPPATSAGHQSSLFKQKSHFCILSFHKGQFKAKTRVYHKTFGVNFLSSPTMQI